MVTPNLVYSAAALQRMWGLLYRRPADLQVREWSKVVWVWVPGHRPTFVPKAEFQHHFTEWRRESAQALQVSLWDAQANRYAVHNEAKGSAYVVEVSPAAVACSCRDYKRQVAAWGQGCCKHGYAVLSHLGFSSLDDYLSSAQPLPTAA